MSITQEINRIARGQATDHLPSGAWYPSQIGGCDRAAVLKHGGIPAGELSDETIRYFWLGNLVHDGIQRGLGAGTLSERMGLTNYLHEVPIKGLISGYYNDIYITATLSGRIDTLKKNPCEVVELKTVRSKAFDYPLPQSAHILQVSCYLAYPPDGFSPERARIVYVGKDGDKVAEYLIEKDEALIRQVDDTILRLEYLWQRYLTTGQLPSPLGKVPMKKKGQIIRYVKSGAWGKSGDPKMTADHRTLYCDYRNTGVCCGKNKVGKVGAARTKSKKDRQDEGTQGIPSIENSVS